MIPFDFVLERFERSSPVIKPMFVGKIPKVKKKYH